MLSLTVQERRVFLFVSLLLVLGFGLNFFIKTTGSQARIADISFKKTVQVIDINTATRDELIGLPGIGPKAADDIIAHRSRLGGFKAIEELGGIKGISSGKLGLLKKYLSIQKD